MSNPPSYPSFIGTLDDQERRVDHLERRTPTEDGLVRIFDYQLNNLIDLGIGWFVKTGTKLFLTREAGIVRWHGIVQWKGVIPTGPNGVGVLDSTSITGKNRYNQGTPTNQNMRLPIGYSPDRYFNAVQGCHALGSDNVLYGLFLEKLRDFGTFQIDYADRGDTVFLFNSIDEFRYIAIDTNVSLPEGFTLDLSSIVYSNQGIIVPDP